MSAPAPASPIPAADILAREAAPAAARPSFWARAARAGSRAGALRVLATPRAAAAAVAGAGVLVFTVASVAQPTSGKQPAALPAAPAPAAAGGGGWPKFAPLGTEPYHPPASPSPTASSTGPKAKPKPGASADTTPGASALAGNGIPKVALNAYRVAAGRMATVQPGCKIDWALLAAIGRVESNHGRFGGAELLQDGSSTQKIVGPALNGHGTKKISAPANGAELAGDTVYAHALGPMQFIPSTWAIYGADGNGDGVADVFNINDAALAAARYLCAAGGDLTVHANVVRAVMAYNQSASYNASVLALADAYRHGISITGIPIGDTSSPLKPVKVVGAPPPANPGGPTAVDPADPTSSPKPSGSTAPKPSKSAGSAPTPTTAKGSTTASNPNPNPTSGGGGSKTTSSAPAAPSGTTSSSTSSSSKPDPTPTPTPTSTTSTPDPDPTTSTPDPTPTPTPTKTKTCKVWLIPNKTCLIP